MAKFCTKCGRELKEGEKCSCSEGKTTKTTASNKGYFSDVLSILKGMFTKPVSTLKEYSTDNNLVIALILMGVCVLFGSLFVFCLLNKMFTTVSLLGGGLSTMSGLGGLGSYSLPFASIFFKSFLYILLYYGILLGMILLMAKVVFKSKVTFKKVVIVLGLSSFYMAGGLILGTLFSLFAPALALRIFGLVALFSLLQITAACESVFEVKKDQVLYVMGPTYVAAFIFFFEILSRI